MGEESLVSQRIQQMHGEQLKAQQQASAQKLAKYSIAQEAVTESFQEWEDLNAWNPLALSRNFQNLEKRAKEKHRGESVKTEKTEEEEEFLPIEKVQAVAEEYEKKNPELSARSLLALRSRMLHSDTVEDIFRKIKQFYHDVSLVDEAIDFLVDSADKGAKEELLKAKKELNEISAREIKAGRNMGAEARAFSLKGLGSPTALRDLYREITKTPKEPLVLFNDLSQAFPFDKLKVIIVFILRSLGAEIKSKGPSISLAELQSMFTDVRSMRAILGVFRFFQLRMRIISSYFKEEGLELPPRITFEFLAKLLMKFLTERYPSSAKALLLAQQMGLSEEKSGQAIIFTQFRDAMRQIAPKLFKDERHRQDLLLCFLETLETLEEQIEKETDGSPKKKTNRKI